MTLTWAPIALGLGAAIGWGTADFLAKRQAEAEGSKETLLWLYLVGFPIFGALWLSAGMPLPALPTMAFWVFIGIVNALAYVSLYRGFRVGLLSVVTTTNAAWAAITITLAIVFLGEEPGTVALAAIGITLVGVVLIAYSGGEWRLSAPGFREGLAAALFFGVSFFFLKHPLAAGHPYAQAMVLRGTGLLVVGGLLLVERRPFRPYLSRPPVFALVDSAAFLCFVAGLATGAAYLVSPLGSLLTPVAVALAAIFLKEHLRPHQWAGFLFVVVGSVLLASWGG
jgi:drug/metabolite transporter (DMT)-like permease